MTDQPLTVNEVLRHMNHDFLNHLQLIKMNLALENVERANEVLMDIAQNCNRFFVINSLHAERLVEWLHTCEWRFPAINMTIDCAITDALPAKWDHVIRDYLETTLQHIANYIDAIVEQNCQINIISTKDYFELNVEIKGRWTADYKQIPIDSNELVAEVESYSHSLWRYSVLGSKEVIY